MEKRGSARWPKAGIGRINIASAGEIARPFRQIVQIAILFTDIVGLPNLFEVLGIPGPRHRDCLYFALPGKGRHEQATGISAEMKCLRAVTFA